MELRVRNLTLEVSKRFNGDVQALMPLKSARKQDDEFPVISGSRLLGENSRVHMIDYHRTIPLVHRPSSQGVLPKMIQQNDVVDKSLRYSLDGFQQPYIGCFQSRLELASEKLGDDVVNIKNEFRTG
jgi:hypothetical protein